VAEVDTTSLAGEHVYNFSHGLNVDHVSIYLTTLGHDAMYLSTVAPRRVIRAGWFQMLATFDDGAGAILHSSLIRFVDAEVLVTNFNTEDSYWDSIKVFFPTGTVGRLIVW
jgi:hypothetical protein